MRASVFASARRTKLQPMKPAPPVTSQVMRIARRRFRGRGEPAARLLEAVDLFAEVGGRDRRDASPGRLAARLAAQHRVQDVHPVAGHRLDRHARHDLLPVDRLEQRAARELLGVGGVDVQRRDDVARVDRAHLDHALEPSGLGERAAQRVGVRGRADDEHVLDRDRAVDQVEQEVHHRADRQVEAPRADLLGLEELELVEQHRERRHLGERGRPARDQLAHLAAAVDHLEHELRDREREERRVGERRERAREQLLADAAAAEQEHAAGRVGAPARVHVAGRWRRRRRSGSRPSRRRGRRSARALELGIGSRRAACAIGSNLRAKLPQMFAARSRRIARSSMDSILPLFSAVEKRSAIRPSTEAIRARWRAQSRSSLIRSS